MMNYAPLRQSVLPFLAIGAVIGLIIGLLIGWVFWPVEWTGASLRDLNTAEKAEYISAVADAFVIYDSPEAAEVAQRRLAPLDDGNLDQAFQDALRYFGESQFRDRAFRDSNIRRLAVGLNMSPPTIAVAPQELATTSVDALPATPASSLIATPPPTEASSRLGWIGWVLWFLTALLLLAGGIYILNKAGLPDFQSLFKSRSPVTDEIDEFNETTTPQYRRQPAITPTATQAEPGVDYFFDQEEEEWPPTTQRAAGQPRRSESQPSTLDIYRRPTPDVYGTRDDIVDDDTEDEFDDDDFDDEGFQSGNVESDADTNNASFSQEAFDEEEDEEEAQSWRPAGRSYTMDVANEEDASPGANLAAHAIPPTAAPDRRDQAQNPQVTRRQPLAEEDQEQLSRSLSQPTPPLSRPSSRRSRTQGGEQATPGARARAKVIDQHIFHYQAGMAEYDESRPIVDPQSGKYIGEFGMGASSKNAVAQIGPDQLVALEVWLFDKSDERNLGNQTRILLSEYAVDHNLEQMFLKERQDNPRPFTAQPGVHFQLESQNLLLDCTIIDVEYSTNNAVKGIYQQITVDMTVQQKQP
jgi:hypothetical protein